MNNDNHAHCPFCMSAVHSDACVCSACGARKTTRGDANGPTGAVPSMLVLAGYPFAAFLLYVAARGLLNPSAMHLDSTLDYVVGLTILTLSLVMFPILNKLRRSLGNSMNEVVWVR